VSVEDLADSLLLALEKWIFPSPSKRTLLVTCGDKGSQILVSSMIEAMKYIPLGLAGVCGVRSSTNPKTDPAHVELIEGLHIDIDSPENIELARHLAKLLAEQLNNLGVEPLVIFTGGKGYALRVFLDKEYYSISPAQYRRLAKEVASLVNLATVETPHPASSHIRVPFTRHEKTKEQVLLFDWRSEKHVESLEDIIAAIDVALEKRFPYIEELVAEKDEEEEVPKKREVLSNNKKKLPRWVEALIEYLKETGELCHIARVAVAQWMYVTGHSEDEIVDVFRYAKDFKENRTRYHVRYEIKRINAGYRPISCKRVKEECSTGIPKDLCGKTL